MALECNHVLVYKFNKFLLNCKSIYNLGCNPSSNRIFSDIIQPVAATIWKREALPTSEIGKLIVYAKDKSTDEIVSFVGFSFFLEDENRIQIGLSGTDERYERRGLSTLLRLYIIYFGIINGFDEVTSNCNEKSRPILLKLGFEEMKDETYYENLIKKKFPQKGRN